MGLRTLNSKCLYISYSLYPSVAGVDELNMCTMRLRLRLPDDVVEDREMVRKQGPDLATRTKEKVRRGHW